MISKQVILGSVLLIGGAVTIFAMTQNNKLAQSSDTTLTQVVKDGGLVAKPETKPLTADVMTEEKLLIQKQKERELYNQQLAQEADELLKEQEQARMLALDKAKQEAGQIPSTHIGADSASKSELIAAPEVQIRPEAVKAISTQKNALEDKLNQQKPLTEKNLKKRLGKLKLGWVPSYQVLSYKVSLPHQLNRKLKLKRCQLKISTQWFVVIHSLGYLVNTMFLFRYWQR